MLHLLLLKGLLHLLKGLLPLLESLHHLLEGLLPLLEGLLHLLESLHHLLESLHHLLEGLLLYLHLVELHPLLGGHLSSKGGGFHNTATSRPNRKRKNAGRRTETAKILRPRISMKTRTE